METSLKGTGLRQRKQRVRAGPDFDQKKNKEWQIFDPEAARRPGPRWQIFDPEAAGRPVPGGPGLGLGCQNRILVKKTLRIL